MLKSLLITSLQQLYLSIPYHPIVVHFMKFCHGLPQELKVSVLRNPLNILKLTNFFFMMKKTKFKISVLSNLLCFIFFGAVLSKEQSSVT